MTRGLGRVAAPVIALGQAQPFPVPAFVIARNHAARGLEAFADRAAAFLCFSERAAELIGHPRELGPVMPAVGFEVGVAVLGYFADRFVVHPPPPRSLAVTGRSGSTRRRRGPILSCSMREINPNPLGGENKAVEIDKTFIGPKARNRKSRNVCPKEAVVSFVERDSKVLSTHVSHVNAKTLRHAIVKQDSRKS